MTFEYFDIPFRYNETSIKLLFQNPFILFVFWDISDEDEKNYIDKYGQESYNNSSLFLKISNMSKGYNFEVNIDPFAKTWYIDNIEPDCIYKAELFRKINNVPILITSSNTLSIPTDKPYDTNYSYICDSKFINSKNNEHYYVHSSNEEVKIINSNFYSIVNDAEINNNGYIKKENILNNPSSFSNISSSDRYIKK